MIAAIGEPRAGVLDPLRLRAAVLRRAAIDGDRALRAWRVRREGHSRGAGRRRRAAARAQASRASASCSWPAKNGAAMARWRPTGSASQSAFLDQRRAHRQPSGRGDAWRVSRPADRGGPRRAFRISGARRVGDREARRRADRAPRSAPWPADDVLGTYPLFRRPDRRRRRAERRAAARGGGNDRSARSAITTPSGRSCARPSVVARRSKRSSRCRRCVCAR